ncbi:Trk system potassium transporter TrkA [Candidatus Odyssella acanthamoebae]|uniref:Trk system potassium uptake protein TrkA n=1 Tax=Candidatus Odyssella acanthamoebae TaxID=91604 RepID=A0A077AVQ7_9PROT|nr:Trk system potassium transporter TrkA [Candidatus Paracaedibacter acanthamoebae]AIK96129.1 potassium transporter TrkA [Candidatus Paracaedibacter acanthamoebae]
MKVVILGGGQVGFNIARYLSGEDNDITIVDQSGELLRKLSDSIDIQPVVGYASHPDVLERAGLYEADLLIAVTASDEVNIVACEVANSLFKVPKKIARIRNQSYLDPNLHWLFNPDRISIDHIISPESEVACTISRSLQVTGAFDVKSIDSGEVKIVGVRCDHPSAILNTPLKFLPSHFPKLEFMIACIYRNGQMFIPSGEEKILLGDEVYFIAHQNYIPEIMRHFHQDSIYGKRILIVGAGSIGLALAQEMETNAAHQTTKIIERKATRAELVARQLRHTEVLCGDALDAEILTEANIHETDTIVCVTEDDKVNILAALLAKQQGASRALILLNNMDYASLVTSLGIDAVISPHAITVSTILQYVRQGQIRSVHSLKDGEVEIIEAEAKETTNVVGLTLEDITIRGQIEVAGLYRSDQFFIMPSKTTIRVGDRLILAVTEASVPKVERLFAERPGYL